MRINYDGKSIRLTTASRDDELILATRFNLKLDEAHQVLARAALQHVAEQGGEQCVGHRLRAHAAILFGAFQRLGYALSSDVVFTCHGSVSWLNGVMGMAG